MTRLIRNKCFETNSSSTHSITLVNMIDYEKWKSGELSYHKYNESLVSTEEADEINKINGWSGDLLLTYTQFNELYNGCHFKTFYETKVINGVGVVAFGYHGLV